MKSVRIPLKIARDIRDIVAKANALYQTETTRHALIALGDAMAPKKFVVAARKARRAKQQTRKEKTAAIYEQVAKRADGHCECCGEVFTENSFSWSPQMDHFHSGANKRALESVEGCWLVAALCHQLKGISKPSRRYWLKTFLAHSKRHGLNGEPQRKAQAELDSLSAQSQQEFSR